MTNIFHLIIILNDANLFTDKLETNELLKH